MPLIASITHSFSPAPGCSRPIARINFFECMQQPAEGAQTRPAVVETHLQQYSASTRSPQLNGSAIEVAQRHRRATSPQRSSTSHVRASNAVGLAGVFCCIWQRGKDGVEAVAVTGGTMNEERIDKLCQSLKEAKESGQGEDEAMYLSYAEEAVAAVEAQQAADDSEQRDGKGEQQVVGASSDVWAVDEEALVRQYMEEHERVDGHKWSEEERAALYGPEGVPTRVDDGSAGGSAAVDGNDEEEDEEVARAHREADETEARRARVGDVDALPETREITQTDVVNKHMLVALSSMLDGGASAASGGSFPFGTVIADQGDDDEDEGWSDDDDGGYDGGDGDGERTVISSEATIVPSDDDGDGAALYEMD